MQLFTESVFLRTLADDEVVGFAGASVLEGQNGPVSRLTTVPHSPHGLTRLDHRGRLQGPELNTWRSALRDKDSLNIVWQLHYKTSPGVRECTWRSSSQVKNVRECLLPSVYVVNSQSDVWLCSCESIINLRMQDWFRIAVLLRKKESHRSVECQSGHIIWKDGQRKW